MSRLLRFRARKRITRRGCSKIWEVVDLHLGRPQPGPGLACVQFTFGTGAQNREDAREVARLLNSTVGLTGNLPVDSAIIAGYALRDQGPNQPGLASQQAPGNRPQSSTENAPGAPGPE